MQSLLLPTTDLDKMAADKLVHLADTVCVCIYKEMCICEEIAPVVLCYKHKIAYAYKTWQYACTITYALT